jgi:hypothetical protein
MLRHSKHVRWGLCINGKHSVEAFLKVQVLHYTNPPLHTCARYVGQESVFHTPHARHCER